MPVPNESSSSIILFFQGQSRLYRQTAASQQHKVDYRPTFSDFSHQPFEIWVAIRQLSRQPSIHGNVGTSFWWPDDLPDVNQIGLGKRCWNVASYSAEIEFRLCTVLLIGSLLHLEFHFCTLHSIRFIKYEPYNERMAPYIVSHIRWQSDRLQKYYFRLKYYCDWLQKYYFRRK